MSIGDFISGVEFNTTSVAAPNLSSLRGALDNLPENVRAKYYAGFLNAPSWTKEDGHIVWPDCCKQVNEAIDEAVRR